MCTQRLQLNTVDDWTLNGTRPVNKYPENPRVIGLGRCMEKMIGELTDKVGVVTEKIDVYTGSLFLIEIFKLKKIIQFRF